MSVSQTLTVFLAKYLVYLIIALVAFWFLARVPPPLKKRTILFAVVSLPLTLVVSLLAAHFYYDPRPFMISHVAPLIAHEPGNGFPSHHTLLGAALASLVFRYDRRFGVVLFILTLLVGLARVHAGLHHLVDILGSFFIAGVVASIVYLGQKDII